METSPQASNQDPAAALSAFNPIDRHFASFLGRMADNEPEVQLAAALVSYCRGQGHICLDLEAFDGDDKGIRFRMSFVAFPSQRPRIG